MKRTDSFKLIKYLIINILLINLIFLSTGSLFAITGLEVMTKVDTRNEGNDQKSSAVFELINRRGRKRIRKTIRFWKNYRGRGGFDAKMITFFESPPDVKGTGFLSWSYMNESRDDDQWLYLPALRKIRRISASDKDSSFMGTDFTFDDMGERNVGEDRHKLIKSDTVRGIQCYVIESVPKKSGYIYSKKVTWVDNKNWIPVKVDYYDRRGRSLKTLTVRWQKNRGIWTWKQAEMKNHLTGHKTLINIRSVRVNTGMTDSQFRSRILKRGAR